MGYFSVQFNGSDLVKTFKGMEGSTNTAYLVLLIASATALVTGILGTLLYCIKHRCYTVLFGSLLTIVWLVALLFGLVLVMLNGTSNETLESFCASDVPQTGMTGQLHTFVKDSI